jgi:hypothetical protein
MDSVRVKGKYIASSTFLASNYQNQHGRFPIDQVGKYLTLDRYFPNCSVLGNFLYWVEIELVLRSGEIQD